MRTIAFSQAVPSINMTETATQKVLGTFGLVWFGLVWFGLVWFGLVWFGLVWFGWIGSDNTTTGFIG